MFDFLKKKKEPDFGFEGVDNAEPTDEVTGLDNSGLNNGADLGTFNTPIEPKRPEIFQSSSGVTERDIQLIVAKIDLMTRRLEDVERKLDQVLEIAKENK